MSHINHYQAENKLVSSYNLNGDILSNVDSYLYLGVIVSSDLNVTNIQHPSSIRPQEHLISSDKTFTVKSFDSSLVNY
jgi:hypothetical protein